MKRVACVYNQSSGSALSADDIRDLFAAHKVTADCFDVTDGETISQQLQGKKYEAIVAVGGDGTVNATARLAVQHSLPLGVIPAGTLNHFAKDLGLPLQAAKAVVAIVKGKLLAIDYATVNGELFINNSSIGIYPSTVLRRERKSRLFKWPATAVAFVAALFRHHTIHAHITTPTETWEHRSPLIFVGNNEYQVEKVGFTKRETLSRGQLFLYAVQAARPMALLLLALLSLIGMRRRSTDFRSVSSGPITIKSSKASVNVAIDGEIVRLHFPLDYKLHAQGLKVYK